MTQIDVFLENGSKDFRNFWHEVRGPKLEKSYGNRFGPKTPVLQNSGPTTRFGTEKLNFFKHRHVTPRWKSQDFRITKKIFLVKFGFLGRNLGQKGSFWVKIFKKMKNFQKIFFFDLNDSESKKGQKKDEKFFSLPNWSDTQSFQAKIQEFLSLTNFEGFEGFEGF